MLTIADRTFDSRLFTGTGKFPSHESTRDALAAARTGTTIDGRDDL
jgi:thiazole synthase ThiGH ThiG subunit